MRGCQSSARFPSTLTLPLTLMKGQTTRAAFSAYYCASATAELTNIAGGILLRISLLDRPDSI